MGIDGACGPAPAPMPISEIPTREKCCVTVSTTPIEIVVTPAANAVELVPQEVLDEKVATASPRIAFGAGAVKRLPEELEALGCRFPLIVSSPSRIALARRIQSLIANMDSRILDAALVSVPTRVVDGAVERITGRDCVISIGGASAVGLARAISVRKDIPHICIPTTSSGCEVPLHKNSKAMRKRGARANKGNVRWCDENTSSSSSGSGGSSSSSSRRSRDRESRELPAVIIYDEDLTMDSQKRFAAPTGGGGEEEDFDRGEGGDEERWSYIHLPGA